MLSEAGKKMAQELAKLSEVKQAAQEPALKTTQNSYGYYAQAIQALADATGRDGKEGHFLAAEALHYAGGNRAGIDSAMSAMFGYDEYDPMRAMLGR